MAASKSETKVDVYNSAFDKHDESAPLSIERHEDPIPTDPSIRDWMIPAMFSCLYCYCSLGICAVYYAFRANHNVDKGNLKAARKYTSKAKKLTLLSIGLGIPTIIIILVLYILGIKWYVNYIQMQEASIRQSQIQAIQGQGYNG